MSGLHRLAIVGIVAVVGVFTFSVVDWERRPIEHPTAPVESPPAPSPSKQRPLDEAELREIAELYDDSFDETAVPTEVPANIRELERSRRAQRLADSRRRTLGRDGPPVGASYAGVLTELESGRQPGVRPAEAMPPTSCNSVERAPKHAESTSGPHWAHDLAVSDFISSSGFGVVRMWGEKNTRGAVVPSRVIDRVELVSLLTEDEPSVYVLDQIATPLLARQAKRRPLDEFERLGLDAVRRGEHLVWSPEAPKRMFGAIRARTLCLDCHVNAKKGDLLGAFTYYLEVPVDELAKRERR